MKLRISNKDNIQSIFASMKEEANVLYNNLVQQPTNNDLIDQYKGKNDKIHAFMNKVAIDNKQ